MIKANMGAIPNGSTLETLLDEIERLNLELSDQAYAAREYQQVYNNLILRNQDLEARTDSLHVCESNRMQLKSDLSAAEHQIVKLKKDLEVETGNRDHFRSLLTQQDAYLKELKVQIEQWKADKLKELQTKTSEAEHLAKQAVRLNEENTKLQSRINELECAQEECHALIAENAKFKEQNNRLLEENRKLHDKAQDLDCEAREPGPRCGGCLSCQLRQAKEALKGMNDTLTSKMTQINVYLNLIELHESVDFCLRPYVMSRSRKMFGSSEPKHIMDEVALLDARISEQYFKI